MQRIVRHQGNQSGVSAHRQMPLPRNDAESTEADLEALRVELVALASSARRKLAAQKALSEKQPH